MKFLVDAQLPPAFCRWLRDHGQEAEHIFDIGMIAASDGAIAAPAGSLCAALFEMWKCDEPGVGDEARAEVRADRGVTGGRGAIGGSAVISGGG